MVEDTSDDGIKHYEEFSLTLEPLTLCVERQFIVRMLAFRNMLAPTIAGEGQDEAEDDEGDDEEDDKDEEAQTKAAEACQAKQESYVFIRKLRINQILIHLSVRDSSRGASKKAISSDDHDLVAGEVAFKGLHLDLMMQRILNHPMVLQGFHRDSNQAMAASEFSSDVTQSHSIPALT